MGLRAEFWKSERERMVTQCEEFLSVDGCIDLCVPWFVPAVWPEVDLTLDGLLPRLGIWTARVRGAQALDPISINLGRHRARLDTKRQRGREAAPQVLEMQ